MERLSKAAKSVAVSGELETNSLIQESMAKLYGLCQKRIAELD